MTARVTDMHVYIAFLNSVRPKTKKMQLDRYKKDANMLIIAKVIDH